MKHWLILLLCCLWQNLFAQLDTLLNRSFNERFHGLQAMTYRYPYPADSVAFRAAMAPMESFARAKQDQKLLLELDAVSFIWLARGNADRLLLEKSFESTVQKARQLKYREVEAAIEITLSDYYWNIKEVLPTFQHLEKAFELAEKFDSRDFYLKQEIAFHMALRYYALSDNNTALYYLAKARAETNPLDPDLPQISILNTIGLAYMNQGNLDTAITLFNQALELANRLHSKVWIANLSGNIGYCYVQKGQLDRAESLLLIDKKICLERNAKMAAVGAMLALADLYMKKGQPGLAIQQIDSVMLFTGGKIPFSRKKALFPVLSKIKAYQGDWEASALYLDSSLVVIDSLSRLDNAVEVMRLKQLVELQSSKAEIAQNEADNRRKNLLIYAMLAGLALVLTGAGLVLRQKKLTDKAKQQSDELLLNILPRDVVDELTRNGISRARKYQDTTVLFSDFKDFTRYAEAMEPEELVRILDAYFKAFDEIVAAHGLEKIKTVGDAYLCVCGLPGADPDHALKAVQCARKMQEWVQQSEAGWLLRIGIHSGPVVAGIVGIRKFAYDIWGDTVNTAARMEQHAEAGRINLSQATYEQVKTVVPCTYRGKVDAKNKGELDMYYVD